MPPTKRKANKETEAEPVKQKKGKAKEESNGVQEELPKRSVRARKPVFYEELNESHDEPKRGKAKATKKEVKPAAKTKKGKAPKKSKKNVDSSEEEEPEGKSSKKSKKNVESSEEEEPEGKSSKKSKKNVESSEEDEPEGKSSKKSKKNVESSEEEEPEEEGDLEINEKEEKPASKAKAKEDSEEESENGKSGKKKVLLNKTKTDWDVIDFTCKKKNGYDLSHNLILSTWNIGGLKSWMGKDCLEFLNREKPDIFCIQETKCNESKIPDQIKNLSPYKKYWLGSKKEGYAGVGIFTVKEPKNVTFGIEDENLDEDGRCITAEYDTFYLVNVYVPNSGRKLVTLDKRLKWNESFKKYIKKLDEKKPVIICGDMNVSHQEIDLARPKNNTKNAGFTPEEREGMTEFLKEGFVDVYRNFYPDEKDVYSFWTYMANARSKNVGWRLDYFIVSEKLVKDVCDIKYRTEVLGSDHCPLTLFINL